MCGGGSSFPSYFVIQRKKSPVKKIKGTEHCGFKLMLYNCFIIIKLEGGEITQPDCVRYANTYLNPNTSSVE